MIHFNVRQFDVHPAAPEQVLDSLPGVLCGDTRGRDSGTDRGAQAQWHSAVAHVCLRLHTVLCYNSGMLMSFLIVFC